MRQALFLGKGAEIFSQLKTDKIHRLKKLPLFSGKIDRKKGKYLHHREIAGYKKQCLEYGSWLTNNFG